MPSYRDTFKFYLKRGNKILRTGITNDLQRRGYELQQQYGEDVHVMQVGSRTTREEGFRWEAEQGRKRWKRKDQKAI